ncbi:MAG: TonB-dependent receptor [Bacteroidetes bacterium]|nr:MAG: TonB-dependent receptor [Bacteroidota bacterium]
MKIYFLLFFLCFLPFILFSQNNECKDMVLKSELAFKNGNFNKAIEDLNRCFTNLTYIEKVEARKIKAKSYLAIDSTKKSKQEIQELIFLKPDFEPAYDDSPLFEELFTQTKNELESDQTSSVSKRAEKIELAPATMSVITDKDIKKRGYQDVEQIFHDLSGFDISRSNGIGYSNLYQRGYRSASSTDRTLVLVDGVEDNELYTNIAFLSRQFPLSYLKKVEVIYGPASTMYGSNAFLGVINIVTKEENDLFKAGKSVGVSAYAGAGTYQNQFADLTLGFRKNKAVFTVSGRIFRSNEMDLSNYPYWKYEWKDDYFSDAAYLRNLSVSRDVPNYLKNKGISAINNENYTVNFDANGNPNAILPTNFAIQKAKQLDKENYIKDSKGNPLEYSNAKENIYFGGKFKYQDFKIGFQYWKLNEGAAGMYGDYNTYSGSANGLKWNTEEWFVYARYDKYLTERLYFTSFSQYKRHSFTPETVISTYGSYGRGSLGIAELANNRIPTWADTYYYQSSSQFRTEARFSYNLTDKLNLLGGAEFRSSNMQGDYVLSSVPQPNLIGQPITKESFNGGNQSPVLDLGTFAQFSYKASAVWNFVFGHRLDYNSIKDGNLGYGTVNNSRLVAVFSPQRYIFKLMYSEAFKDASFFNKYATSLIRKSNPKLKPEQVKNIEFSSRWTHSEGNYAEFIAYYAEYSNVIEEQTQPDGTTQFVDNGNRKIAGFQFNSNKRFKNYEFYFNATSTFPQDNGVRVGDIAKFQCNFGANAHFFMEKLNLNCRLNYVGERLTGKTTTVGENPFDKVDPYLNVNTTISYEVLKGLNLQMIINNLLDSEYFDPGIRSANAKLYAPLLPQNRRTLQIRLAFDWK